MAKKINVKLILELRAAHMSRNGIAASRHISKNSVGDVFHIADEKGITYDDIRELDDEKVYRMFFPDKYAVEQIKEQGYNPKLAMLRLSKTYSEARLEAACEFALTKGIIKPRYHHLKLILAANQDKIYLESKKLREPG